MKKTTQILLFLMLLTLGFYAGLHFSRRGPATIINISNPGENKLGQVLGIINAQYVDSIDIDSIIEKSIPKVIEELDPHSTYIPVDEVEAMTSDLQSSFSGIGIRFTIQEDTVNISEVIRGGPSEDAGVLAGDKIITVNDSLFVGKENCDNEKAMKKLKGPKGSFVTLSLLRYGEDELVKVKIRRDDILVESIEAAYLIDNRWGYVQIQRFAENTYMEFIQALLQIAQSNPQGLIIDLRGNGGGYMAVALEMANQFLEKDDVIVYTEGANAPTAIEKANGYGLFKDIPLVILVDETSASASEILAGTVQDNDRGTIIGRRTFGKGLVQQQIPLYDGSLMRLTIARYHTPSGRCIQKPYTNGDAESYAQDLLDRFNRGEFFSQDSIHQNEELVYTTKGGRTVFGGGGIMPDIFVSSDTTEITRYTQELAAKGLIAQFALKYSTANRHNLSHHKRYGTLVADLKGRGLFERFVAFAKERGIEADEEQTNASRQLLERSLYSNITYQILGMQEHIKYINLDDPTVLKAVEVLENGKAFPEVNIQ
ncbi:MAG: S41 family peptidase [Bacteroidaceae bacterium]|nr:S41 family peptidase [Bacteroidaceae bacterium]